MLYIKGMIVHNDQIGLDVKTNLFLGPEDDILSVPFKFKCTH